MRMLEVMWRKPSEVATITLRHLNEGGPMAAWRRTFSTREICQIKIIEVKFGVIRRWQGSSMYTFRDLTESLIDSSDVRLYEFIYGVESVFALLCKRQYNNPSL